MPRNPNFTARLSTLTRARIEEACALSKLAGRPHSIDRVLARLLRVCNAKARLRLRAAGKDVDGELARLRAEVSGRSGEAFRGVPGKPDPRVY